MKDLCTRLQAGTLPHWLRWQHARGTKPFLLWSTNKIKRFQPK